MTTSSLVDDLRGMHGRGDRRRRVDHAELAKNALFEIGEAGALAGAPAAPRHRDAADDAEVELRHVLEADRLAMLQEPCAVAAVSKSTPLAASFSGSMRR